MRSLSFISHNQFFTSTVCRAGIIALSLTLAARVSPTLAGLVQFDFNDNTAGALAGQFGGTGADASAWLAGASHVTEAGDLVAPAGTNFGLTQSAGTALSVSNDGVNFSMGQLARPLDTPLVGEIWFSFLADVPVGATRNGLGFAGTSGGTSNPRLIFLNDGLRWLGTGDTDVVGSGLSGGTNLVVGNIKLDDAGSNDTLDVWINPDLSSGLGAPLISLDNTVGDLFGSSIANINVNSYGSDSGAVDFISLSDTATAFMDVTGQAQILQAEWINAGSGNWGTGSNWDLGSPPDGVATIFGSAIGGAATVTLDQDRAVADLTFDNSNSYTLTANTLTVSGDVAIEQGSHTIASDLALSGGTRTLTSSPGANLNVTGTTTTLNDSAATIVLSGEGNGSLGAIRDNNNVANPLDGIDNINVIKRGSGTWTIGSGATTLEDYHGGNTTIEAGTLKVNGNGADGELRSPTITVQAGATLDTSEFTQYTLQVDQRLEGAGTVNTGSGDLRVSGAATVSPGDDGAGTLTINGDLTLAGGLGGNQGSLAFELSETSGGANDQIVVTGDLDSDGASGTTTINIIPTGSSLASSYELITFSGNYTGDNAADFAVDNTLQTRFTRSISVDTDSVNLDITGSNANLTWAGTPGDNDWRVQDATADSWTGGGGDNRFFDLDTVNFDDSATEKTVNVDGNVSPATMTINNSSGNDYTFSGTGAIAGPGSVAKSGTGRATITTANTYSGTTTITGGVLHAANNSALGSTAAGTTVNGGTLDITDSNITGETVSIEGAGSDGRGALITDGLDALGGGTQQISDVIQTGDATIGAYSDQPAEAVFDPNDYRWDLEPGGSASSSSWQGNGHNLTKKGRGTVSIQGTGDMNIASLNIEQGVLFWQGSTTATGATVTVGNGTDPWRDAETVTGSASLSAFYGAGTAGTPPTAHAIDLVLQGGIFEHQTSNNTFGSISGSITQNDVTGDGTIDNAIGAAGTLGAGLLVIPNGITGTGDLQFVGLGGVVLQGNNTYTGRTEVVGNLQLSGAGQLSGTPRISVIGGGNLDVTGRTDGTLTVASGRTLVGELDADETAGGRVTGNVVVQAGGTLQLNTGAGAVPAGTLAFQQNANTIGSGNFPYVAFEAENYTNYEDQSTFDWVSQAVLDSNSDPALGGQAIVGTNPTPGFIGGDDDLARYDVVFSEPGTYTWYVRTRADSGANDSFFGPSQDLNTANPNGVPAGSFSAWIGNGSLQDAEGGDGITTDWDWVRSNPAGDAGRVAFEKVVVTQEDVDAGRVFSLSFEPRQVGATLDKMALVATPGFTDLTDADLDAIAENATAFSQPPAPTFAFVVDGDLTLQDSSTVEIDIRSLIDFDHADVTGTADLDGTLSVNLDDFVPSLNDTFDILTAGTLVDSGIVLGGPDASAFSLSTADNTLTLTFTGLLTTPGDFDEDGDVDGADFLAWQRNPAVGDLSDWQANYPSSLSAVSASTAVPEPATLGLCLIGAMIGGSVMRKRS